MPHLPFFSKICSGIARVPLCPDVQKPKIAIPGVLAELSMHARIRLQHGIAGMGRYIHHRRSNYKKDLKKEQKLGSKRKMNEVAFSHM